MSNARRAVFQVLNNEWSRGVWKHWLSNIFEPPADPPMPPSATADSGVTEPVNCAPLFSTGGKPSLGNTCAEPRSQPLETSDAVGNDSRRLELRARFEALSDRLMSLEDGLDTLLRRSAQRDKSERRSESQNSEVMESVALLAERQATVLEGLLGTVSRLEHALSRLEHGLSRVERALGDRGRRDSYVPTAAPSQHSTDYESRQPARRHGGAPSATESGVAPRERAPASSRSFELDDSDPNETSSINGFLSELSLSTVLAMLEIERRTGRLKVATDDGMLASFELSEGSVASSRLSEIDADPLHTLRTALRWKYGRFWFHQQPSEASSGQARSIGSLLLEASRQNDESFAEVASG